MTAPILDLEAIAEDLGGEIREDRVYAPGPEGDEICVWPAANALFGFHVASTARDGESDYRQAAYSFVRDKLGILVADCLPPPAANDNHKPAGPAFARTNTADLMAQTFEPVRWIIPGYVPEGLTLLAGRQKLGKTWLAIDWATAVASGGRTLGVDCEAGDVLYIDLENGERRIQRRIQAMWPLAKVRPNLDRLDWASESRC